MKRTRRMTLLTLAMSVFIALAGCDYVGSQNVYNLPDADFALLSGADLTSNAELQFSLTLDLRAPDSPPTRLELAGNGLVLFREGREVPDLQMELTGTATESAIDVESMPPTNVKLEIRLIDGTLYLKATDLDSGETEGWQYVALSDLAASASDLSAQDLQNLQGFLDALGKLDASRFTTIENLGAADVNGVATMRFRINIDLLDVLASPEFFQLLMLAAQSSGDSGLDLGMSGEELQQMQPFIAMALGMLLRDVKWQVDEYVDADGRQRRSTTMFTLTLDLSGIGAMLGGMEGSADIPTEPMSFNLNLDTWYSNYGVEGTIEAPEGATPMDASGLDSLEIPMPN